MMLAEVNMLLPDSVYGAAVSTRVPWGNSFRPVNRKPPLEMSSHATTNSPPLNRMHADVFIPARRFLRRSSLEESRAGSTGSSLPLEFEACPRECAGLFSCASRRASLHGWNERQDL